LDFLLTDLDEAAVSYHTPFREHAMEKLGKWICPNGPSCYSMTDWLGVKKREDVLDLIRDFNSNACGRFERLPAKPGAQEAIANLSSLGYKIVAISSCGTDPKTVSARKRNAWNLFGDAVSDIHCVNTNSEKRDLLQQYPPSPWIEDHPGNAQMGLEFGHKPFLMESSHNKDAILTPSVRRVSDWHNLHALLVEELSSTIQYEV
jgi:hypothetical protein